MKTSSLEAGRQWAEALFGRKVVRKFPRPPNDNHQYPAVAVETALFCFTAAELKTCQQMLYRVRFAPRRMMSTSKTQFSRGLLHEGRNFGIDRISLLPDESQCFREFELRLVEQKPASQPAFALAFSKQATCNSSKADETTDEREENVMRDEFTRKM
jgi:hypothetical protein